MTLPLAQQDAKARSFPIIQVLDGPPKFWPTLWALLRGKFERETGYVVDCNEAVAILEERDPEAAAWWRENAPHMLRPGRKFIFASAASQIVGEAASAYERSSTAPRTWQLVLLGIAIALLPLAVVLLRYPGQRLHLILWEFDVPPTPQSVSKWVFIADLFIVVTGTLDWLVLPWFRRWRARRRLRA
jgi:hypothetical protein